MLSLDTITLAVPQVAAAHRFYTSALSLPATEQKPEETLDLHGAGGLALHPAEVLAAQSHAQPATTGFRGYVLSYVVTQPSEVEALLEAAVGGGATVLKPARKGFFGGFSAVYRAPDGAVWKLAAPRKKDTGPAGQPPLPAETIAILGVADPVAAKEFYTAMGLTVDRDYGSKFVDFRVGPGACRLALMQRTALAKDAGVDPDGAGGSAVVFHARVGSADEVDSVLKAAAAGGGTVTGPAEELAAGGYGGHFSDPDGFRWKVSSQ